MLSAPTRIAPALSRRATNVASRAAGGKVRIDARTGECRDACDVEKILDGETHAGERARIVASSDQIIEIARPCKGALGDNSGKGVDRAVTRAN